MDLIGGISAATEAIKLTKELRSIDREIDKAELKLRLIEVIDHLLEAKEALQDAKQEQQELQRQIDQLKSDIARRAKLEDQNGLLFEKDDAGARVGEPYCNLCFVKEEKLFRMRHKEAQVGSYAHYRCDNCKTVVITGPSLPQPPRRNQGGNWMR